MRSLVIVVMMVLLPLRMWAGDAMALSMSSAGATSASAVAAPAFAHAMPAASMPLVGMPCHGDGASTHPTHTTAVASLAESGTPQGASHESESAHCHALCDVCNGPAMAAPVTLSVPNAESPRLTPPARERFASQPLRRDVRPPIA